MSAIPAAASYPLEREADVVLRDGATVHVRPVRAEDGPAMRVFFESVSPDSIWFRFFGAPNLDWATSWSVNVDYADRFGLVVESGNPRAIIAHAVYVRIDHERAEVAFLVADAWQARGISTILLAHLAEVAEQHGISTLFAQVLPHNYRMIQVFRESGFPVKLRSAPETLEIELPTSLSAAAVERFEERERIGAVAAVRSFLEPSSVAVIGASRRRGTIGGEILHNLLAAGFSGAVYAVNNKADVVQSLPAYRSVGDIPGGVELAVVAVPSEQVVGAARECAEAGVRSLLVISSGFAETGAEGAGRQHELLEVCRDAGIRVVGPNCLGVLNTSPRVRLNATFAPAGRRAGRGWVHVPERGPRDRDHRGGRVASGSDCRRSSRSETSPICPATTFSSTGSRTPTPSWRCSTSSHSATPGSSRASPAGCRPPSRSWRSRADGPPRAPARPRRIPARCCRPRT